jgi:hypothetical protein
MSIISIDLFKAARRSERFPKDWNAEETLVAIDRYEKFLKLVALDPSRMVAPTRDIDEIWHLHMLSPRAYAADCMRLIGEIVDHDGGFGAEPDEEEMLSATFAETARRWEATYGEPYVSGGQASMTNCKRDCQGRCWHACKSVGAASSRP